MRYRDAGVDIDAASQAKARIKQLARSTFSPRVLREVGAFGGFFSLQGLPARRRAGVQCGWRRHQAEARLCP